MPKLKLGRLPERTPVKIAITVSAELNQALRQYAEIYRATYGQAESVGELIPFMLDAFLESDRGFAKARKDGVTDIAPPVSDRATRLRREPASSSNITNPE